MSETLSNVLNRDPVFTVLTKQYTNTATKSIPVFPVAGTVVEVGYTDTSIFGKNTSGATVWTLAVATVNGSAARFVASLARIDDNTCYVLASNSAGTTYYIATLNFTTGGITSPVTIAANPASGAAFGFSANNFYDSTAASACSFQKKLNGNLAITKNRSGAYFEFTTAGTLVTDTITGITKGICDSVDENFTFSQISSASSSSNLITVKASDKYGSGKSHEGIVIGGGCSLPPSIALVWPFGSYVICPAATSEFQTVFLRSDIDKVIKRAILESGGRTS